jgi:hypothetical protein
VVRGRPFKKGQPKPPGSGRKKGTPNRFSPVPIYERIRQSGADPIEVMVEIMGNPKIATLTRLKAAALLAEYVYPKPRAVEVSWPGGAPLGPSADDLKAALKRALADVARERAELRANGTPGVVIEGTVEPRPGPQPEPVPLAVPSPSSSPPPSSPSPAPSVAAELRDDGDGAELVFEPEA